MTDERFIDGVDPYDAWDREAARIEAYCATVADDDPAWEQPSDCEGWSVRDVLAHLRADEDYFTACLAGTVAQMMTDGAARGVTGLDSFNDLGIADQAGKPPSQILTEWSAMDAATRKGFRERDGGEVDSSVGPYSARWQAFHLASELATHADDMHIPSEGSDLADRTAWRAPFSRFALSEAKEDLTLEMTDDGQTRVHGNGVDITLDDQALVVAVSGRSGDPSLEPLHAG